MTRSNKLTAISSLPFALGLALLGGGCSPRVSHANKATPVVKPVSVKTGQVTTRALPRALVLTGTLTANSESAVAADVSGKVLETFVERGARVGAGTPLARLDHRQATLLDAEARSQATAARVEAELARIECQRAAALLAEGAINQADFDRTTTRCQATAQNATAASMRQRVAGKTLGDLVIKAPFAGVIAERFINPGEYLRPDSKVVTIVQLDPLRLELAVPESAVAAVHPGGEVTFQVAAFPGQQFVGQIRYIGAQVRRATRDLLAEATVANPDERLRPGMFAVTSLRLGEETTPVVPTGALRTDERAGTDRVFVVIKGRVEERLVHKGPVSGDVTPILAGVRPGEQIVLSPAPTLRDGLRVQ